MHEGHRERMREKYLQNGIEALAPHEVLELLLFFSQPRVNTNETAHLLMEAFQSFSGVFDADVETLAQIKGVGKNSALLIHLVRDCMNLYEKSKQRKRPEILSAMAAGQYALRMVGEQSVEHLYIICLDSNRRVLSSQKVLEGSVNRIMVDTRLVVEHILEHKAVDVILVHNHPNGPAEPSDEDIALTKKIQSVLNPLGISCIDHIIIGEGYFYSMAAHALM